MSCLFAIKVLEKLSIIYEDSDADYISEAKLDFYGIINFFLCMNMNCLFIEILNILKQIS